MTAEERDALYARIRSSPAFQAHERRLRAELEIAAEAMKRNPLLRLLNERKRRA